MLRWNERNPLIIIDYVMLVWNERNPLIILAYVIIKQTLDITNIYYLYMINLRI
jgi:hypothetical protein